MKCLALLFVALASLVFSGCDSPTSRIRQNPAAFDLATPEQQALVKEGRIAIGFEMELVKLALGMPDHEKEQIDANGKKVVWSYVNYEGPDGMVLYRGWYHRGWGGPHYAYFADYPERREREHFRVIFQDSKVIQIEQETR